MKICFERCVFVMFLKYHNFFSVLFLAFLLHFFVFCISVSGNISNKCTKTFFFPTQKAFFLMLEQKNNAVCFLPSWQLNNITAKMLFHCLWSVTYCTEQVWKMCCIKNKSPQSHNENGLLSILLAYPWYNNNLRSNISVLTKAGVSNSLVLRAT